MEHVASVHYIVALLDRLEKGDYQMHPAQAHWYDNLARAIALARQGEPVVGCHDPWPVSLGRRPLN